MNVAEAVQCAGCGHRLTPAGASRESARPASIADVELTSKTATPGAGNEPSDWAGELAERVARFKRRSASAPDRDSNLRFDFGKPGATGGGQTRVPAPTETNRAAAADRSTLLDGAFEAPRARAVKPALESIPIDRPPARSPAPSSGQRAAAPVLEFSNLPLAGRLAIEPGEDEVRAAPLGKRFVAGVIDALILGAAFLLFAGIFVLAGGIIGRIQHGGAVAALIAAFWTFAYFALFTAEAHQTPGQSAMGLVVRDLDGRVPGREEALLRAFGYLVSIVSLMLGFLWAAMDSDAMAWHDHISGTLLVEHGLVRRAGIEPAQPLRTEGF